MEAQSTRVPESSPPPIAESFNGYREMLEQTRETLAKQPQPSPEQRERSLREAEERERRASYRRFLDEYNLRDRFGQCTLDSFQITEPSQQNAVDALRDYADNMPEELAAGSGLLLLGAVGRGKDHLLMGMARIGALQHGIRGIRIEGDDKPWMEWKNGLDLYGDLRDGIKSETREKTMIARYEAPKLLIVSDPVPPTGRLTDHQAVMLQRIVDARYRCRKPLWITANAKSFDELGTALGFAVADRLADAALVIKCTWKGHRKPKRVVN